MCLLILISLALVLSSCAFDSEPQDYEAYHNLLRTQVGAGFIFWNDTVASYAQNYANSRNGDCSLVPSNGPYGENLAAGSSNGAKRGFSGVDAISLWWNEIGYYNYGSNSCATGKMCGNYTQIVWRKSTSLGCGHTRCKTGGWFVICSYEPLGNLIGERPY